MCSVVTATYARTPGPQDPARFDMSSRALEHLLGKAAFAMSTDETRYYLNGVYLHRTNNVDRPALRAGATDGHRLARVDVAAPQGAEFAGVILPRKAIGEIIRLAAAAGDANVTVEIKPHSARFAHEDIIAALASGDTRRASFQKYETTIRRGTKNWYDFISVYYRLP